MDTQYVVTFHDKSMMVFDNIYEYGMFTHGYSEDDTWSFFFKMVLFALTISFLIALPGLICQLIH